MANGTAPADLNTRLGQLKDQTPQLAPAIRKVEAAQEQVRHDERWKAVQAEALSLAAIDDPATPLATIDAFLRDYPDTPRRAEALALARSLKNELANRQTAVDRQFVDDLIRSESLPNVSLSDQIERSPAVPRRSSRESGARRKCKRRLESYLHKLDDRDIERARELLAAIPDPVRDPHRALPRLPQSTPDRRPVHQRGRPRPRTASSASGTPTPTGRPTTTPLAHPDDVAEVARRLRDYLRDHPDGRYAADAQRYLDWWDKVSVPGHYRVTLRRGEVEPTVGKYLAGGAPTSASSSRSPAPCTARRPVIRDSHRPIWDYTFPQPITWKLGDPVTIRIIDYDWSASEVYCAP